MQNQNLQTTLPPIRISTTEEDLTVVVGSGMLAETFIYPAPGMISGADLVQILEAYGIPVNYHYQGASHGC